MPRRLFLCPVIGPVPAPGSASGVYRAKVPAGIDGYIAKIPSNPDGTPRRPWALVVVDAADHAAMLADPEIDALPNIGRDVLMSSLSTANRNALRDRLLARGLTLAEINAMRDGTFAKFVRRLCEWLGGEPPDSTPDLI